MLSILVSPAVGKVLLMTKSPYCGYYNAMALIVLPHSSGRLFQLIIDKAIYNCTLLESACRRQWFCKGIQ